MRRSGLTGESKLRGVLDAPTQGNRARASPLHFVIPSQYTVAGFCNGKNIGRKQTGWCLRITGAVQELSSQY